MSTLGRVSNQAGLEKTRFTYEAGLQEVSTLLSTGINVSEKVYNEASPEESVRTYESSELRLEKVGEAIPSKKPSFLSYNSPVDTHSIT